MVSSFNKFKSKPFTTELMQNTLITGLLVKSPYYSFVVIDKVTLAKRFSNGRFDQVKPKYAKLGYSLRINQTKAVFYKAAWVRA